MDKQEPNKAFFHAPEIKDSAIITNVKATNPKSVVLMRTDQTAFTELVNMCFE